MASIQSVSAKGWRYLQDGLLSWNPSVAYVGGWLGQQNLGDEALFAAYKRLFPHFSLWHHDGSRTCDILLSGAGRIRAGLFAGGTLINRAPEYLAIARRFTAGGRSLHFFGVGIANPAFWNGRDHFVDMLSDWEPLLNQSGCVHVRGPRSAQLLLDAGIRDVEVVGDPALVFAEANVPSVRPDTPAIGLNIGFDHGHQWGNPAEVHKQMACLARRAKSAGWKVKWFVVYPQDEPITREIAVETGTATEIFCEFSDAGTYLDEVAEMTVFVGMKLHATLLALCAYVPSLMLEYEPKCADFMDSINAHDALIRTDQFRGDAAWERIESWLPDRVRLATALHLSIQSLQRHQLHRASELAATLAAET